jgi:hypothetical protein
METTTVPLEHEKYRIDVSCLVRTRMHYVARWYHRMRKHKFGVRFLGVLFVESVAVPPEHKK